MKALSVIQPWASVICSGIKNVENRLWQSAKAPGRILIHATKTKVPGNWENCPDDYVSAIKNARLMGIIPEYKEMPYGSIIGYVTCDEIVRDSESFWAQPDCFHWCLKDAYLFDEPITGINGVRGHLFDVDIDENNLPPARQVDALFPVIAGDCLEMPASREVMSRVEAGEKEFWYDFDVLFSQIFCNPDNGELFQPKTIKFICGDKVVEKEVELIEVGPYTGEDDKPIKYIGFDGNKLEWSYFVIVLK